MRALAALAATLAFAAPATADEQDTALVREALATADSFWAANGSPLPCTPDLHVYDDGQLTLARGTYSGCRIGFETGYLRTVGDLTSDTADTGTRRATLRELCGVAIHERGHNLGFRHDEGGIMTAGYYSEVPGECWDWAAAKAPLKVSRYRDRRSAGRAGGRRRGAPPRRHRPRSTRDGR